LHGIPIALKDLLDIEGRVTTGGSVFWRDRVSSVTATAARRLAAAGMIALGKTHMVEFAFGSWGTNTTMGAPWNPWDLGTQRAPGGSSSGSGVAVAAALAPAAIGSDTGGSVRIPAGLCGIVGLKTTVGRVSNYGVLMLSDTLDTLGPMTRDVEDAALLFSAMHGPDPADLQTLAHPPIDVMAGLKTGVAGLRLAVLPDEELGEVDSEVARAFASALDLFRNLGARIDRLKLPAAYGPLADLTGKIIAAEGYELHRNWIDRDDLPFDADVRGRMRGGKAALAADYVRLTADRRKLCREVDRLLSDFDGLVMPTTPLPAIPLTEIDQSKAPMSRLTRPINLLDLCALALPCGFTKEGLPISLQVVGRGYDEARPAHRLGVRERDRVAQAATPRSKSSGMSLAGVGSDGRSSAPTPPVCSPHEASQLFRTTSSCGRCLIAQLLDEAAGLAMIRDALAHIDLVRQQLSGLAVGDVLDA
jgi:aspartyl-tRNA(Asn)/glutamyl-tRNA(Gln) amidotransferase subunit A